MNHSFDVDVAVEYGVNAAIIFNNISFLCKHNEANNINHHDGKYWTFNSRKAFCEVYPYLTEKQIRTALERLVEGGMLETGNYNKYGYDRTTWYTVTDKGKGIVTKWPMDLPSMANGNALHGQPIPDINTDRKQDNIYVGFDDFWSAYPKHEAKKDAIKAWNTLKPNEALRSTIIADMEKRLASGGAWYKAERKFIPLPATYLRGARWEDEPSDGTTDTKPDEPYWKKLPWWEWPKEEQERLERECEERERRGEGLERRDSTH